MSILLYVPYYVGGMHMGVLYMYCSSAQSPYSGRWVSPLNIGGLISCAEIGGGWLHHGLDEVSR